MKFTKKNKKAKKAKQFKIKSKKSRIRGGNNLSVGLDNQNVDDYNIYEEKSTIDYQDNALPTVRITNKKTEKNESQSLFDQKKERQSLFKLILEWFHSFFSKQGLQGDQLNKAAEENTIRVMQLEQSEKLVQVKDFPKQTDFLDFLNHHNNIFDKKLLNNFIKQATRSPENSDNTIIIEFIERYKPTLKQLLSKWYYETFPNQSEVIFDILKRDDKNLYQQIGTNEKELIRKIFFKKQINRIDDMKALEQLLFFYINNKNIIIEKNPTNKEVINQFIEEQFVWIKKTMESIIATEIQRKQIFTFKLFNHYISQKKIVELIFIMFNVSNIISTFEESKVKEFLPLFKNIIDGEVIMNGLF